ncbi:MAG: hypothetical protein M3067_03050 [Chloroflexota bacterium]|nr:hypothetical protein [Chloroflexota bacterium]
MARSKLPKMDWDKILPGVIGATVGAVGWLMVGMYMQRRQVLRQARNAARAVFFELDANRMNVAVALEYGAFTPLARASYERLLADLASLLTAVELQAIVVAYGGHAGYAQAEADSALPQPLRERALRALLTAQERALDVLRPRVFSKAEQRALQRAGSDGGVVRLDSETLTGSVHQVEETTR